VHRDFFPEMLQRDTGAGASGWGGDVRPHPGNHAAGDPARQIDGVGKLPRAGARLNNPAAAAQRAAKGLKEAMTNVREASLRLLKHPLRRSARRRGAFEREVTDSVTDKSPEHSDRWN